MVVPWLRMIRIGISLIGKPRVDVFATTRVRIRIWPNDLDANLHVNNGRYLTLADLGRIHWFVRTGVYQSAKRHGTMPVVGDAIAKYRRELKAFQAVDIGFGRAGSLGDSLISAGATSDSDASGGPSTSASGASNSSSAISGSNSTGGLTSPPPPSSSSTASPGRIRRALRPSLRSRWSAVSA